MSADELPGWRETTAKQSIMEFVAAVTDPDSPDFIPERDRIAVFDNDGTLWTESLYAWAVAPARSSPPPLSTSGP